MTTYRVMDTGEEFEIEIPEEMKRMRLFVNMMTCNVCGEMWRDSGSMTCPFCESDEIEPVYDDEDDD